MLFYPLAVLAIYSKGKQDLLSPNLYSDPSWMGACLLIALLGLAVRAYTIGHTPRGTSGRNTKEGQVAEVLNTAGIYSTVRHPLYVGNYLMWLGLFMYVGNVSLILIASLIYWVYYERIMYAEEAFLRKKFGSQYDDWASQTPAFLIDARKFRPAHLKFSLRNVLKREYNGLFNLILSFVLINLVHNLILRQAPEAHKFWIVCLLGATVTLLVLRTLKKKTRILHVEGR